MDTENRKRIGILFNFDKNWIGGLIYIINIIKALKVLPDEQKPSLILFYSEDNSRFVEEIKQANYEYISFIPYEIKRHRILSYFLSIISRKNLFVTDIIKNSKLDGLFPLNDLPTQTKIEGCKIVSWFPDFQHKFYSQYFSKTNLVLRELRFDWVFKRTDTLVLSSQDAHNHFKLFNTKKYKTKVKVLPFVSIVDDFDLPEIENLRAKYKITKPYFMVSNQFYEHKNHILVFQAINELKNKNKEYTVIFTGKMEDYRNPKFIQQLKDYITENEIERYCTFLAVLPRAEQLSLMKNALCVIQPSKFEGWSTVVEDAKSLQVPIITSDIEVHKEQLEDNAYYFGQDSPNDLSELMQKYLDDNIVIKPFFSNYNERLAIFAQKFVEIFNS